MDLNTVQAMSNKKLRIKAAKLVGFTRIGLRLIPVPWLMDLVEEELSGYLDGKLQCIPNYLNDIAAAMELISILVDQELRIEMVMEGNETAIEIWTALKNTRLIQQWQEGDSIEQAIVRTFVLTMMRGGG